MAWRCEDCRWWDSSTQPGDKAPDTHGVCRAMAPVADDRTGHARWPFTEDTDWCGMFSPARSVIETPEITAADLGLEVLS